MHNQESGPICCTQSLRGFEGTRKKFPANYFLPEVALKLDISKFEERDALFQFFPSVLENVSFSASAILNHSMELSPAM